MKQKQTSSVLPGILFAILVVLDIKNLITILGSGYAPSLGWILRVTGYAVITFALLTSRRDIVLLIGFAISALASLLGNNNILSIVAWLSVLVIGVAYLTNYVPQLTKTAKSIWFVPAICVIVGWVIYAIQTISTVGWVNVVPSILNNIVLVFSLLLSMNYVVNPPRKQQIEVAEETAEEEIENLDNYAPNNSGLDAVEEMKKYKDLLDSGAISQEEFDAKKKQLLGL